jgi:hypothetical protein
MVQSGIVTAERIESIILFIRGQKVILDRDLAELYGVTTGNLNKAVRRNLDRFPPDFMFQLKQEEYESLRFHFGILKRGQHSKYMARAFTEQGVAMLSSVLRSKRAVHVNIEIMRAFVRLRQILTAHKDLERKLVALENKYDEQFRMVFEAIRQLMRPPATERKKIGFEVNEPAATYRKGKSKGVRKHVHSGNA